MGMLFSRRKKARAGRAVKIRAVFQVDRESLPFYLATLTVPFVLESAVSTSLLNRSDRS